MTVYRSTVLYHQASQCIVVLWFIIGVRKITACGTRSSIKCWAFDVVVIGSETRSLRSYKGIFIKEKAVSLANDLNKCCLAHHTVVVIAGWRWHLLDHYKL